MLGEPIDTNTQIKMFEEYFKQPEVYSTFLKYKRKGRSYVKLDYSDLLIHNTELAYQLLESPEETLKAADLATESLDMGDTEGTPFKFKVRFFHLPQGQRRHVWQVRGEDVGKLISLRGVINKASDVHGVCVSARFECPSCANIITVTMDGEWKEATRCTCGRKGKFRLMGQEMMNQIKLGLIDDLMEEENKDRGVAREKLCLLTEDLTSHEIDTLIKPGKPAILNGFMTYVRRNEGKGKSAEFTSIMRVNSVEFIKTGWDTVRVTGKEEERIKKLSKEKNIIKRLSESIADVHGHDAPKQACLLLLAGAPHLYDDNEHLSSRGTIHVLLIGNPGSAKSYLMRRAGGLSPINRFQSASTASGKGLIAAVSQDKDLGAWVIYPGIVPMASGGVALIDEIDKTHEDDYGEHNNAMNDMEVPISKANVKGKLDTVTSYLATANPEERVFTDTGSYFSQIDMPRDFLDRFDYIFVMMDPSDEKERDRIMDVMLERHLDSEKEKSWKPEFSHEFITKYVAYCRRKDPKCPSSVFPEIKKQLLELMQPRDEGQTRVSFRQLESVMRFAYASARLHLRDVTEEDVRLAIGLKRDSFIGLKILDGAGSYNWNVDEGVQEEKLNNLEVVKQALKEFLPDARAETGMLQVIGACVNRGVPEDKAEEIVEKLIRKGDYFEPRPGMVRRI